MYNIAVCTTIQLTVRRSHKSNTKIYTHIKKLYSLHQRCTILPSRNTTLSLFCLVPDFLVLLCIYVFCALIPRLLYLLQLKKIIIIIKINKFKKRVFSLSIYHSLSFTLLLLYLLYTSIEIPIPQKLVLRVFVLCLIGQNWPVALWRDNKISFIHSRR